MTNQLPRARRLNTAAQFQSVFAEPMKTVDAYFTVLGRLRMQDGLGARLGLAIARKYIRSAVRRNRVKRLVRESFRCQCYAWVCLDVDCIVINRRPTATVGTAHLRRSLEWHWFTLEQHLCDK